MLLSYVYPPSFFLLFLGLGYSAVMTTLSVVPSFDSVILLNIIHVSGFGGAGQVSQETYKKQAF